MAEEIVATLKIDESALQGKLGQMAGDRGAAAGGTMAQQSKKQTKDMGVMSTSIVAGLAIWEGIKKGIQSLVKASPALQNTLQIFGQTMSLLLKPIGDLFSMILRPFALAFLKFAIPFYKASMKGLQTTGGKIGGVAGVIGGVVGGAALGAAAGGALGLAGGPLAIATAILGALGGAVGGLIGINVGAKIEEWGVAIKGFFDGLDWAEMWSGIGDFFTETIPIWVESLVESIGGFFLDTLPEAAGFVFESIVLFFKETVPNAIKSLGKGIVDLFTVKIPNAIAKIGESIIKVWNGVGEFIMNIPENIIKGFDKVKVFLTQTIPGWFNSLFDGIGSAIDRIKSAFSLGRSRASEGRAVGGPVFSDSSYIVGENGPELFTPTAGGTITPNNRLGTTLSPNITIQATINNDIDIRRLATRLSDYMQGELTRSTNDFRR